MELPEGKINLMIELEEDSVNTVYTGDNLETRRSMKKAWFSGIQSKAVVYKNNNHSAIMSIRFTLDGFFSLTRIPVTEISYSGLEVELLLGNKFSELYQKLINEEVVEEKFRIIEEHFLSHVTEINSETLLSSFLKKNLDKPIDWLVTKSGYSQKHLIQVIKKETGFSPKYLQRLNRFKSVVDFLQGQTTLKKINWASIALDFGYYDQAHFIKEFIHFTGLSPSEYFQINDSNPGNQILTDVKLLDKLKR